MADSTDTTRPGDGWSCPRCDRVEPHGHSLPVVGYVAADLATRPGETEAVEAARLALLDIDGCGWDEDPDEVTARAAVAAAYPVIAAAVREQAEAAAYEQGRRDAHGTIPARIAAAERAVREQAARDIEAAKDAETGRTPVAAAYRLGLEDAAEIVRGGR